MFAVQARPVVAQRSRSGGKCGGDGGGTAVCNDGGKDDKEGKGAHREQRGFECASEDYLVKGCPTRKTRQACLRSPLPPEGACLRSVSALAPLARLRSGLRLRASARLRLLGCSARLRFRLSARLRLLGWISVGFGLILGLVRLDLASGFHLL